MQTQISVGDRIQAIDRSIAPYPMTGRVVDVSPNGLDYPDYLIEVDSPANPAPQIWVNGRLCRKEGKTV